MTSIHHHIKNTFLADLLSNRIQVTVQLVIQQMVLSLIHTLLVAMLSVVWNKRLVPTIRFITILILNSLAVTRQVDVNDISRTHTVFQLFKAVFYTLMSGQIVCQCYNFEPLFCQQWRDQLHIIGAMYFSPRIIRIFVLGIVGYSNQQSMLLLCKERCLQNQNCQKGYNKFCITHKQSIFVLYLSSVPTLSPYAPPSAARCGGDHSSYRIHSYYIILTIDYVYCLLPIGRSNCLTINQKTSRSKTK